MKLPSADTKPRFADINNIIYDGMYGLAVADALGVPYEMETVDRMKDAPCTGMIGFRRYNQPAGSWSDDTAMSLCLADSLSRDYDIEDMMKRFSRWLGRGEYTAAGKAFDAGGTCRNAIRRFQEGTPPEYCGDRTINGNGNGALMRTFPIALYQCIQFQGEQLSDYLLPIHEVSALTHAHEIGLICCGMFSLTLKELLENSERSFFDAAQSAFQKGMEAYASMGDNFEQYLPLFTAPAELMLRSPDELPSSGYALNTWNIALWSLLTTDNYHDCVLKAINLGGDTDTNGAVAGALAGVVYGKASIPGDWIDTLLNKPLIDEVCARFNKKILGIESSKTVIDRFEGAYAFLSMKAPSEITIGNHTYQNLASAFYALGVAEELRCRFENITAKKARKVYKDLQHDDRIEARLYTAVKAKSEQDPVWRQKLLNTASLRIVYDTTGGHDNVLGRCRCAECSKKDYWNLYGNVLMCVREELISEIEL